MSERNKEHPKVSNFISSHLHSQYSHRLTNRHRKNSSSFFILPQIAHNLYQWEECFDKTNCVMEYQISRMLSRKSPWQLIHTDLWSSTPHERLIRDRNSIHFWFCTFSAIACLVQGKHILDLRSLTRFGRSGAQQRFTLPNLITRW